jgi:hypothetical protein
MGSGEFITLLSHAAVRQSDVECAISQSPFGGDLL